MHLRVTVISQLKFKVLTGELILGNKVILPSHVCDEISGLFFCFA